MSHRPVPLNLLRTFEVAGRHLSFTLAAQELCISTSAVSQQIRNLEEQLEIPLFERQTRALQFTPAGQQYWQEIQKHLQAIDTSTRKLADPQQQPPLRVSLMPPLASRIVLPNLEDFYQHHPDTELRINANLKYADLARNEADLAIRYGQPPWPGCTQRKLLDLYVLPVCPATIAEQYQLSEHPENLALAPLVQMTERPDSWDQYLAAMQLQSDPAQKHFYVDDYPAAIEAAETLGVALAILPLEQPLLDNNRLVAPLPAIGPLPESVYAVIRQDMAHNPAVEAFLSWLETRISTLPVPEPITSPTP